MGNYVVAAWAAASLLVIWIGLAQMGLRWIERRRLGRQITVADRAAAESFRDYPEILPG